MSTLLAFRITAEPGERPAVHYDFAPRRAVCGWAYRNEVVEIEIDPLFHPGRSPAGGIRLFGPATLPGDPGLTLEEAMRYGVARVVTRKEAEN